MPGRFAFDIASLLVFFGFVWFFLPHGEFAGVGESGLDSEARQDPAVENVPGGKYANKDQE